MVQWAKLLATKSDDLSPMPWAHGMEKEVQLPISCLLTSTHMLRSPHFHSPTHTNNKKFVIKKKKAEWAQNMEKSPSFVLRVMGRCLRPLICPIRSLWLRWGGRGARVLS